MTGRPVTPESFWARVDIRSEADCWEWTGARGSRDPYGFLTPRGKHTKAHRFAWALENGPIPEGLVVRHKCDNPPCVNPRHLEIGTQHQNALDAKERLRVGHKVAPDQVREIRRRYVARYEKADGQHWNSNAKELAAEFGLTVNYVKAIGAGNERGDVT